MMQEKSDIEIDLDVIEEGLKLWIGAKRKGTLFDAGDSAAVNNEAQYQLMEGCFYDYEINKTTYQFADIGENIIQPHKRHTNIGVIAPNIFVGTLEIPLVKKEHGQQSDFIKLEVQSIKSGYRDNYRDMLELITEKCTDLLLQANSPVSQHFEIDYANDSQTLYQKFSFIKSVIGTNEFTEATHRIITAPVTKWTENSEERDIRNAKRFSNRNIKEVLKAGNRTKIPQSHYLRSFGIETLPGRISTIRKTDSVDTPENRFIKHALENFLKFCTDINSKAKEFGHKKMETESALLIQDLENHLQHTIFKEISRPTTLKLNSPVLQRKEGYREILRVWLMFDLAAKLIWEGGDEIYGAGKKDIATLYEYWLFFKLLDLFESIFEIEPKDISDLIKETKDGLNLQIKQGKFTALKGVFNSGSRKLNIRFNYNRSFSGKKAYPDSGSWTTTLRPDYTLSFWPFGITETLAEEQELIVHIHFDAKYKVENLTSLLMDDKSLLSEYEYIEIKKFEIEKFDWNYISSSLINNEFAYKNKEGQLLLKSLFWEEVDFIDDIKENDFEELVENIQFFFSKEEKKENRQGKYKNADLLKMHAYKDAIRRTGGAYVLYPGDKAINQKGFHEIIPGLGAFPVKPSKTNSGIGELKGFILEIIDHFINRASQREKIAFRTFDVYKNPPNPNNFVNELLPEPYNSNRNLIPDDTSVLVGYYNSNEQYEWIKKTKRYNFRMGSGNGSLILDKDTVSAKYLLLHTLGDSKSGDLWRIISKGPKVFSRENLEKKGYPKAKNKKDYKKNYLIIKIEKVTDLEFDNITWNFKNLENYSSGRASSLPFTTTLTELMNNISQ